MSDNTIQSIFIKLGFDTDGLKKSSDDVENIIKNMATNIGTALSAVLSLDFFKNSLTQFAKAGSEIQFLSQKTGESVSTLGAWQQAVKRFGGTAETFTASLNSVHNAIQDVAVTGGGSIGGLLAQVGVSARDNQGHIKKTTDVLLDLSKVLSKMDKNKAQYIQRQLGIDDATFRAMMMGRQHLQNYLAEMQKKNYLDDKNTQKSIELKRRIDDLSQAYDNLKFQLGSALMPVFMELANILTKISVKIPDALNAISGFASDLGFSSKDIAKLTLGLSAFIATAGGIKLLAGSFRILAAAIASMLSPITLAVAGITALSAFFIANPDQAKKWNLGEKVMNGFKSFQQNFKNGDLYGITAKIGRSLIGSPEYVSREFYDKLKPHEKAQMQKESRGKINAIGDTIITNKNKEPSYGLFQIKPQTAKEVLGYTPQPSQLLDPDFNLQVYRRLQNKYLAEAKGNQLAADARYNGGMGGYNHYLKTGQSYSGYAEDVSARTKVIAAQTPQMGSVKNNTNNNQSATSNINIENVNMPNVKSPDDFMKSLNNNYTKPMSFDRTVNNFQSGRIS